MARSLPFARLVRPYWRLLATAFVAMLVASAASLLEPFPLKLIFDHVIDSKPMPAWLAGLPVIGQDRLALLNAAALAVIAIAVVGAISTFTEKYLSTTVGQLVMHDLR